MIIVWGTINAGKVDQAPGGMFHVMTRFGHVYYLPLSPTGSYLVLEQTAEGFRGMPIPMSFKSILTAWVRAGSIVAIIASLVLTMIFLADVKAAPFGWIVPVLVCIGAIVALFLSYRLKFFTEASYERAKELAGLMGMNEVGLLMIEVAYGRLTAEQAEQMVASQIASSPDGSPIAAQLAD
ncbi:MAG TPA: hypothetical protein VFV87_02290 [Pirellulaceae bacterium]|nr:hypothetical protein [Pirellulaceae bacterium]